MEKISPNRFDSYKMTSEEKAIWSDFVKEVKEDCVKFNIQVKYLSTVEHVLRNDVNYYSSVKGYSKDHGYYYVNRGDRGALFLTILTKSKEEAKLKVLEKILWRIGLNIEVDYRHLLSSEWHYNYDAAIDGKWTYKENTSNWKYNAIYDFRVFPFTYLIQKLSLVFQSALEKDVTNRYISLLSKKNLNFDRFFLEFYLSENTQDKNFDKEPIPYNMFSFYERSMSALETLFSETDWPYWREWMKDEIALDDPKLTAQGFLSGFGGMGSLNDIYISKINQNEVEELSEPWINTLYLNLLLLNSSLSKSILTGVELDEIQVRKIEGRRMERIIGNKCKVCQKKYISKFHLDSFIASSTLSDLLISALVFDEFDLLLKKNINVDFDWVEEKRKRFIKEMKSRKIMYTESRSQCPQCKNKDYAVFYWDDFHRLRNAQFSSRFDVRIKRDTIFSKFFKKGKSTN